MEFPLEIFVPFLRKVSGPPSEILGCSKRYQFTDQDSTVNFPFHSFKLQAWYGNTADYVNNLVSDCLSVNYTLVPITDWSFNFIWSTKVEIWEVHHIRTIYVKTVNLQSLITSSKALTKAEKTRDVFDKLIFKSVTVLVLVETMKIYIPSSVEVIQD